MSDIASEDRKSFPSFLLVPVAVEECKAFVVLLPTKARRDFVNDPGREMGLTGAG